MILQLSRQWFTNLSTIGTLLIEDKFECFTLEDCDRFLEKEENVKIDGKSAIPSGIFRLSIRWSPKLHMEVPWLVKVPRFTDVQIHPGNTPDDTRGCICLGRKMRVDGVMESKLAFNRLMEVILPSRFDLSIEIGRG